MNVKTLHYLRSAMDGSYCFHIKIFSTSFPIVISLFQHQTQWYCANISDSSLHLCLLCVHGTDIARHIKHRRWLVVTSSGGKNYNTRIIYSAWLGKSFIKSVIILIGANLTFPGHNPLLKLESEVLGGVHTDWLVL